MRKIISPRVEFDESVHVLMITSIDDIPQDIQRNLWMSRDELMICMHEAAIARREEEMKRQKQQIIATLIDDGEAEEDQYKEGILGRRNSNTSVIDDEEQIFGTDECKSHTHAYYIVPPVA